MAAQPETTLSQGAHGMHVAGMGGHSHRWWDGNVTATDKPADEIGYSKQKFLGEF